MKRLYIVLLSVLLIAFIITGKEYNSVDLLRYLDTAPQISMDQVRSDISLGFEEGFEKIPDIPIIGDILTWLLTAVQWLIENIFIYLILASAIVFNFVSLFVWSLGFFVGVGV